MNDIFKILNMKYSWKVITAITIIFTIIICYFLTDINAKINSIIALYTFVGFIIVIYQINLQELNRREDNRVREQEFNKSLYYQNTPVIFYDLACTDNKLKEIIDNKRNERDYYANYTDYSFITFNNVTNNVINGIKCYCFDDENNLKEIVAFSFLNSRTYRDFRLLPHQNEVFTLLYTDNCQDNGKRGTYIGVYQGLSNSIIENDKVKIAPIPKNDFKNIYIVYLDQFNYKIHIDKLFVYSIKNNFKYETFSYDKDKIEECNDEQLSEVIEKYLDEIAVV